MSPKMLPAEARPREKLMALGPAALTDAELLALLLRTGTAGRGVMAMADELVKHFNGIAGLLQAGAQELGTFKGLGGDAKRAQLMAVLELSRRALAQRLKERDVIDSPQALRDYVRLRLGERDHEVFAVLFLDSQHRLITMEDLFRGTLCQTSVYPREVVLRALYHHAAAVVFAHNHPSGLVEPSRSDIALTTNLKAALALVDVHVLDHVIVSRTDATTFAEKGLL
jgi:DNA repair protein RadC